MFEAEFGLEIPVITAIHVIGIQEPEQKKKQSKTKQGIIIRNKTSTAMQFSKTIFLQELPACFRVFL